MESPGRFAEIQKSGVSIPVIRPLKHLLRLAAGIDLMMNISTIRTLCAEE